MQTFANFPAVVRELIRVGKFCHTRGWVPATSGNFSARLDDYHAAITVSGQPKGTLKASGIMVVNLAGQPLTAARKPSAETPLHIALYRRDPQIGAVLHTHSANATVLSLLHETHLQLSDYEVLKALPGIDTHECSVSIPVFANDQDIDRLAGRVNDYFDEYPAIPGYLIAGHGFYTWGASVAEASRHIEAFEFLFECEMLMRRIAER